MHFLLYASSLACAIGTTYGQIFVPTEVEKFASEALQEFAKYTAYDGPSPGVSVKPRPTTSPSGSGSGSSSNGNRNGTLSNNGTLPNNSTHVNHNTLASNAACSYWMEDIAHQGIAAFNSNPSSYQVFRNVMDFGARGDGVTDDTAAINSAISSGGRCGPGSCSSTTTSPAVVYFPAGTYMVSSEIVDFYFTQLIGNPNCLPTIKALSTFANTPGAIGVIDGDSYSTSTGQLQLGGATNIFWRQVRNFIIDTTLVPASSSISGIHWPTGQATSLQNIIFQMDSSAETQHVGIFIESGSGGFAGDLQFYGGRLGLNVGNQQFTMRNLLFEGVQTAINQIWDWGWTYSNINIQNCSVGLSLVSSDAQGQSVGSITFIDSSISDTPIGIATVEDANSSPPTGGSLILENIELSNVPVAIQGANGPLLQGVSSISAWGQGHSYTPNGPNMFQGAITPNSRPSSLLDGSKYYQRSKPQYEGLPTSSFMSARSAGATGNGHTDDTTALQNAINQAASAGMVLYVDQGDYLVTNTIYIPAGSKIVGESYSVILSSGSFFNNINSPQPVVQIGRAGETGSVEWSDMLVSTQGQQQGAILFEYNLQSSTPTGLWDVHARIGGFTGSDLSLANCPTTPAQTVTDSSVNQNCIAAYLTFHITSAASGLYLENNWFWTADHDVDDPAETQITIYTGRGFLDQSSTGPIWLVGTSVEHHDKYQYQFANANNVFQGFIQTETAYYQPNPDANSVFPVNTDLYDPTFPTATITTNNTVIPNANGWGLRILSSSNILTYGAGHYSFFDNYSTSCSDQGNGVRCQGQIVSIEQSSDISIYTINTVGTHYPITVDGTTVAQWQDNMDGFVQTIALFRTS